VLNGGSSAGTAWCRCRDDEEQRQNEMRECPRLPEGGQCNTAVPAECPGRLLFKWENQTRCRRDACATLGPATSLDPRHLARRNVREQCGSRQTHTPRPSPVSAPGTGAPRPRTQILFLENLKSNHTRP
jgi:hypothetical protein